MGLRQALAGVEVPFGPLLQAIQEQSTLAMVSRSANKLITRMLADGREVGQATKADGIAAGLLAVVCWRSSVQLVRGDDGGDNLTGAGSAFEPWCMGARVAWRAIVSSISADGMGETIPLMGGAEDDWLCAQALASESRTERAARLLIERNAGKNQARLAVHLAGVTGRGRRAAAVDKVRNCCNLLMTGDTLEAAAVAVGFNVRGRNSASSAFIQAAKRLGLAQGFQVQHANRGGVERSQAGLAAVVPDNIIAFIPPVRAGSRVDRDFVKPVRVVVGAGDNCLAAAKLARAVAKFERARLVGSARWLAYSPRARQAFIRAAVASYGPRAAVVVVPCAVVVPYAGHDITSRRAALLASAKRARVVATFNRYERARALRGVLKA